MTSTDKIKKLLFLYIARKRYFVVGAKNKFEAETTYKDCLQQFHTQMSFLCSFSVKFEQFFPNKKLFLPEDVKVGFELLFE